MECYIFIFIVMKTERLSMSLLGSSIWLCE